jgi:hypothetical protein
MAQPPTNGSLTVSFVPRWSPLTGNPTPDVAAGYLDSDNVEGNGSLSADRRTETGGSPSTIPFTGTPIPVYPPVGLSVTMRSSIGPPHLFTLRVEATSLIIDNAELCPGQSSTLSGQVEYTALTTLLTQGGDSGSPVFDGANRIVGMINACEVDNNDQCLPTLYGTDVFTIQQALRFDRWYGTDSIQDQTIATFRPSTGVWYVDNGNKRWDGNCNATGGPTVDQCFSYGLGGNVDLPVTGDWDGNGIVTVGVFRTSTNPQQFLLSNNNSTVHYTVNTGPPTFGYQPVAGKWAGVNTTTKVGVFRSSTGEWYLDNGNRVVEGCASDTCFNTSAFTLSGDKPLAGDWDNNGSVTIGVFRPSNSTFYLSNNNSTVSYILPAGIPSFGYQPVVGNWTGPNGQTNTKLGIFRSSTGVWYLDNGNRVFPGCAEDQCPAGFGALGDWPAALDKSIIKAN